MIRSLATVGLCALLPGCTILVELAETEVEEPSDRDGGYSSECAAFPRLVETFAPCALPPAAGSFVLTSEQVVFNTTTGDLDWTGGAISSHLIQTREDITARVLVVETFVIGPGGALTVYGEHPFIVVASSIVIDASGRLEASSSASLAGPGANPTMCLSPEPGHATDEGGGGGGGALAAAGGAGGSGDDGAVAGGAGGIPVDLPRFRGGCSGADGGDADGQGGRGGRGGGAVMLVAGQTIVVDGVIAANGQGGLGGRSNDCGGGGGGSGGTIALESPRIVLGSLAVLAANGGGGGGGESDGDGENGRDGDLQAAQATGGLDGQGLSSGGAGGSSTQLTGSSATAVGTDGGGGGGGSAGRIWVAGDEVLIDPAALLSPPL